MLTSGVCVEDYLFLYLTDEEENSIVETDVKVGAKKLKKLEEKATRKAQREVSNLFVFNKPKYTRLFMRLKHSECTLCFFQVGSFSCSSALYICYYNYNSTWPVTDHFYYG